MGSAKLAMQVAAAAAVLFSQSCLAQQSLGFSAVLRVDDGTPLVIQTDVTLGSSRLMRMDDTYLLEFTAPVALSADAVATIRLYGLDGAEYKLLHTSRQDLIDRKTRHVGYRLCAGKLMFRSPSPDVPPDCDA